MITNATDLRFLMPDTIWLEPEQIEQSRAIGCQAIGETEQWQAYLNALALLGFEQWLNERLPEQSTHSDTSEIATFAVLQVGEFKLCLLATEHLLDETICLPQAAIDQPELVSHFYVILEVSEEQEELIVRGFLRYDQLMDYRQRSQLMPVDKCYSLPLSVFDAEPSHLLSYCRFLDPVDISLPAASIAHTTVAPVRIEDKVRLPLQETKTKLSQWIQGAFDETWQAIDTLINPDLALALSTRSSEVNIRRGKLINLGMQLGNRTVALLVVVTPEAEDKLAVLVQLHPTGGERILPPHIKLCHRSKQGRNLQEVESRLGDNYIQLRSFRGEAGKLFSIEISLGEASVKEDFEL